MLRGPAPPRRGFASGRREFPKIGWGGPYFWGVLTIRRLLSGYYIRVPFFRKPPDETRKMKEEERHEDIYHMYTMSVTRHI